MMSPLAVHDFAARRRRYERTILLGIALILITSSGWMGLQDNLARPAQAAAPWAGAYSESGTGDDAGPDIGAGAFGVPGRSALDPFIFYGPVPGAGFCCNPPAGGAAVGRSAPGKCQGILHARSW